MFLNVAQHNAVVSAGGNVVNRGLGLITGCDSVGYCLTPFHSYSDEKKKLKIKTD